MNSLIWVLLLILPGGLCAQTADSLASIAGNYTPGNSKQQSFFQRSLVYVPPAACIGYGFLSLNNKIVQRIDHSVYADMQEDHPGFATTADNYLQYAPAAAVGLLSVGGIKGKNDFADQTFLFAASVGIVNTSVTFVKRKAGKFRPNGSSYTSFPSGHTSMAFAAAEFLNQEYGDRSPWFGIAGYAAATTTGILRVYNNAHWFSDIVAGAGFGILSTKAAYFVYPKLKKLIHGKGKSSYLILPQYAEGYTGIGLYGRLN